MEASPEIIAETIHKLEQEGEISRLWELRAAPEEILSHPWMQGNFLLCSCSVMLVCSFMFLLYIYIYI